MGTIPIPNISHARHPQRQSRRRYRDAVPRPSFLAARLAAAEAGRCASRGGSGAGHVCAPVVGKLPLPSDTALREPRAYLRTIANRLLVDHWRRLEIERSYLAVLQTYPQSHWPSEESRLLILESLEPVAQMLGRLKPEVREVFLLAQMEGHTCPQIARQVGKSVATVERYLAQALQHCYRLVYGV